MINIDFSIAISLFIFLSLSIVLIIWLFGLRPRGKDLRLDPKFIWFCSICTYTYVNTKQEIISVCPRCGSFNKLSSLKK